ncbi:ATP-binding protein [Oceanobacillus salinisoli]|uniref:ATP-binding protein n=1 Tax=Oceanobacillus salinisoli TaxID=2678611 RepID=UPI0012E105DD|nr:ATP-binding protein [Oceanobacillus salinisoli]
MKDFFSKILREKPKKKEEPSALFEPKLSHLTSYDQVKRRALIGWMVSRCAAALDYDEQEREALFFIAFTAESFEQLENEVVKELLVLANSAVDWIEANAVIEEEMKAIQPLFSPKKVLARAFNEVQLDVKYDEQIDECSSVWEVYRDVIYAATHGQFLLIKKSDVMNYKSGDLLCEVDVVERHDIAKARNAAKDAFTEKGVKGSKILSYNLIISEAVTNILKHAEYGKMLVYQAGDLFYVVIEDKGPGFPLKILPKTTLMAGFSTKESLGQGFTLMMKMAEQVVLETSETGSTLILILDGKGNEMNEKHGA